MGPDWADDYDYQEQPATAPSPPVASPAYAPGPAIPTETPPLIPASLPLPLPQRAPSARGRAGLTVLITALGTGVGAALGGAQGAGAGFLITGAARNLYRAQSGLGSEDSGESAKSLTLALLGLAAGGYLVYRCFAKKPRNS